MTAGHATVLTPPGAAALAVVRLVGPGVSPFLARRFSRPVWVDRAVHGQLRDEAGDTVDDPVVVRIDTYTADLTVHGGPWVTESVLRLAEREGFLRGDAEPMGNDTGNWIDAAVARSLPTAATEVAVRMLLAQPDAWTGLRHRSDVAEWQAVLADPSGRWLTSPPTVAVVGPPNVGKSTLANQLFGRPRSITADAPGTTRDWVDGVADLAGLAVVLVDTAGFRNTNDPIEADAIAAGQRRGRTADLTVVVLDRSRPLDADAVAALAAHPTALRVANKADAPPAWHDDGAIATVATMGVGIDVVRRAICRNFGCQTIDPARPRWWTERQRAYLQRVIAALSE